MDKNYNVDDILDEIKRRKSRDLSGSGSASGKDGARAKRDYEGDFIRQMQQRQRQVPPAEAQPPQPRPSGREPVSAASDGRTASSPRQPEPASVKESWPTVPKKERQAQSAPESEEPPEEQRPSVREERLRRPRPASTDTPPGHGDTIHFKVPDRQPASTPPQQQDGFQFEMPDVEKISRNPLDVDSNARSIADKARIRRKRNVRAQQQQPAPPPVPLPQEPEPLPPRPMGPKAKVIDFSAFRPPEHVLSGEEQDAQQAAFHSGATMEHKPLRAELARSREFKLEEIQQLDFGAVADEYGYEDYEEDDGPPPSALPLDRGEYNSFADRDAVARDIAKVKLWLVLRCLLTGVFTGALYYVTMLAHNTNLLFLDVFLPETDMRMYMSLITGLTVAVALVCSSSVGGGLISLFKMRSNSDTLPALALLAAIGQGVAGAVNPESVNPADLGIYACVAALTMFFNCIGKTTMLSRIQANFRLIASERKKRAVLTVGADDFCRRFVRDTSHRPIIAYSCDAGFFTDFLALSYSDKYDVGINRGVAPACLLGSIVVSILTYVLSRDSATALAAFTAILCVSATLSSTFIENIPLGKLTKKLAPQGGMVSGNKAVEDFCDAKAVVLREVDLFPSGHIQLHGIKAYSHGRVDEAILDAASVVCSTESALGEVFLQMIGGNEKLLKKVDSLVYENGMGISAWVNSRRVLIGNKQLMVNHGIALPQDSYDQKYAAEHGEPIYLSNSGEVSAQFIISYHIDEELATALDHLAVRECQLIIHTVDPNLTPHKLWELYGYPEELIEIIPADMHPIYNEMTARKENAIAEIAYTGKASVMVRTILACINARASILAATIIQLVQIFLGYTVFALLAYFNAMSTLNVLQLTAYQLFWFAAIYLVQKLRSS